MGDQGEGRGIGEKAFLKKKNNKKTQTMPSTEAEQEGRGTGPRGVMRMRIPSNYIIVQCI